MEQNHTRNSPQKQDHILRPSINLGSSAYRYRILKNIYLFHTYTYQMGPLNAHYLSEGTSNGRLPTLRKARLRVSIALSERNDQRIKPNVLTFTLILSSFFSNRSVNLYGWILKTFQTPLVSAILAQLRKHSFFLFGLVLAYLIFIQLIL